MDDLDDLRRRLQGVSDKVSLNKNSSSAEAYRSISSSIGTETPLGVLVEIREGQSRLLESLKALNDTHREKEANDQRRHEQMCTILLSIAERGGETHHVTTVGPSTSFSTNQPSQKMCNYYGGYAISSGTYLIACILLHIDNMLQAHPRFKKIQSSDSTHMDVKDWYNVCTTVFNGDKQSKAGLRMPKPGDEDFREAVRMVASPVSGRRPTCDTSHLKLLLSKCPAIMTTVEWMRTAMLKCTGLISPERSCRFRLIKHPFVTEESELSVQESPTLRMPNRWFHQDVVNMKATPRKEYVKLVLQESMRPAEAIGIVKIKQ